MSGQSAFPLLDTVPAGRCPGDDLALHSRSAARHAVRLARALGISQPKFLMDLEWGALLHDVGKTAVPEHILKKAGPLDQAERQAVREHPLVGYRMLEGFGSLRPAAWIVLCHHERYDGRGYPAGLAGDLIPLGARIVALADALDALTSDRAYRRGRSFEEAMKEIGRSGGYQFDPSIVEVFLSVPARIWARAGSEPGWSLRPPMVH